MEAAAPRRPRRRWGARVAAALAALVVVGFVMAATGWGTGDGPLGPPPGYGAGISRDVGDEVTEGTTVLVNDGWFAARIESIRPLPVGDAAAGAPVTAVELALIRPTMVGMADGPGYDTVGPNTRRAARGYAIDPPRTLGHAGTAEVLVRLRVARPGTWHYRGYEVVYRSAGIRHRMVVQVDLRVCTPRGADCDPG